MNPRELVDYIRSGPTRLALDEPLRFRRRTRSNPCDFNEFLQALQSSEIRKVICTSQLDLDIIEDEWVLLVKTLGRIEGIQSLALEISCNNSREFHPFQAVADAVKTAHSLHDLEVGLNDTTFLRDS
jgi:hypothetical protein